MNYIQFLFTRFKTPRSYEAHAQSCWDFTAAYMGIDKPGKYPPVILKKEAERVPEGWRNGNYRYLKLFFWIVKERVWVLTNDKGAVLCHEFMHCLKNRRGDKLDHTGTKAISQAWNDKYPRA